MKNIFLLFSLVLTGTSYGGPLHLDLEMTSEEYRELLAKMETSKVSGQDKSFTTVMNEDPAIREAIQLGERLSKWIALVNSGRTPTTAIRLTSPETRRGVPIEKPNLYSPSIIRKETQNLLSSLPASMKSVLTSQSELPTTLPLDDDTFIKFARLVDRNYQQAARYKAVDRYRAEYIKEAYKDVRGYHYLMVNNITEYELRDTNLIHPDKVKLTKNALALVCFNSVKNIKRCKGEIEDAWKKNKVADFYLRHIKASKKIWNDFFKIPKGAIRKDVSWFGNLMTVPFNIPEIPKFAPYLRDNIEDEFRWKGWELKLNFGNFPYGPYLRFEPGVVPHVNRLGGNEIVMDSNQPIEEYESQWTIRHEFGHIIGLPDCYHEFYDVDARAYVNYQLDITDLMCSRAGNMNERIFKELKEAYSKK